MVQHLCKYFHIIYPYLLMYCTAHICQVIILDLNTLSDQLYKEQYGLKSIYDGVSVNKQGILREFCVYALTIF